MRPVEALLPVRGRIPVTLPLLSGPRQDPLSTAAIQTVRVGSGVGDEDLEASRLEGAMWGRPRLLKLLFSDMLEWRETEGTIPDWEHRAFQGSCLRRSRLGGFLAAGSGAGEGAIGCVSEKVPLDQRVRVVEVAECVSFEYLAVQATGIGGAW